MKNVRVGLLISISNPLNKRSFLIQFVSKKTEEIASEKGKTLALFEVIMQPVAGIQPICQIR